MARSGPLAVVYMANEIAKRDADHPSQPCSRSLQTKTGSASSSVHSALTHSSQNMIGPGMRNHYTCHWRNGYVLHSVLSLQIPRLVTVFASIVVRPILLQAIASHTDTDHVRTKEWRREHSIEKIICASTCGSCIIVSYSQKWSPGNLLRHTSRVDVASANLASTHGKSVWITWRRTSRRVCK